MRGGTLPPCEGARNELFTGLDLQFTACRMMAAPGEAWGDNHPLESRRLMLAESGLMTHTSANCIVMLGAGGGGPLSGSAVT